MTARISLAIAILASTAALTIVVVALRPHAPSPSQIPRPADAQGFEQGWSERMRAVGAAEAYQEFTKLYATDSGTDVHTAAHLMGDVLFKTVGARALDICDDSFSDGCYHQAVADLIINNGPSILASVEATCAQKPGGAGPCIHGLGHGLAEYYGQDLSAALKGCQMVATTSAQNCASGAFMQYGEPFIGMSGNSYAPIDANRPYAPCDVGIPASFLNACYVALPARWVGSRLSIAKVVDLCNGAPSAYRTSCYQGIGIQAPGTALYDQQGTIALCESIPSAAGVSACRKQAAETLRSFSKSADLVDPS